MFIPFSSEKNFKPLQTLKIASLAKSTTIADIPSE